MSKPNREREKRKEKCWKKEKSIYIKIIEKIVNKLTFNVNKMIFFLFFLSLCVFGVEAKLLLSVYKTKYTARERKDTIPSRTRIRVRQCHSHAITTSSSTLSLSKLTASLNELRHWTEKTFSLSLSLSLFRRNIFFKLSSSPFFSLSPSDFHCF